MYIYDVPLTDLDVFGITDLHLTDKKLASVPTNREDNRDYLKSILTILSESEFPCVVHLGDIFNRGINSPYYSNQFMTEYFIPLRDLCNGQCYSVCGNHEISYKLGNPFWSIFDISSTYLQGYVKSRPSTPLMSVPDGIRIGRTLIIFMHYGMRFSDIDDSEFDDLIVFSHNAILTTEISDILNNKNQDIHEQYINATSLFDNGILPRTDKLRYFFVGHMHMANAQFKIKEFANGINYDFVLSYLGSIGRPNHTEYTDDLKRRIPKLIIRNGRLLDCQNNILELKPRTVCVDETAVSSAQEKYQKAKDNARLIASVSSTNNDIFDDVRDSLDDKPELLALFESLTTGQLPPDILKSIY